MTVYELIQELSKYPADEQIIVQQNGARRDRRIFSVNRPFVDAGDNRLRNAGPVVMRVYLAKREGK